MIELMTTQDMDYKVLMDLREAFGQASNEGTSREDAFISRTALAEILTSRFPNLEHGQVLERALSVFDVDSDGKIVFEEFIVAIARVKPEASVEKQLSFVLSLTTRTSRSPGCGGDGLHRDARRFPARWACSAVQPSLDIDGDGYITLTEFVRAFAPTALHQLLLGAMPSHPDISAALRPREHAGDAAAVVAAVAPPMTTVVVSKRRAMRSRDASRRGPPCLTCCGPGTVRAATGSRCSHMTVEDAWKKIETALGLAYAGASEPAGDAGLSARLSNKVQCFEPEAAGDGIDEVAAGHRVGLRAVVRPKRVGSSRLSTGYGRLRVCEPRRDPLLSG